jgi:hypothetical protein
LRLRRHHHQTLELRQHHGLALSDDHVGRDRLLKRAAPAGEPSPPGLDTQLSSFHTESTTVRTIDD